MQLEGEGPWRLPGDAEDVEIILTPGHTQGHIVLLYKSTENPEETACFTGDHLAFTRLGGLSIFKYAQSPSLSMPYEPQRLLSPSLRALLCELCTGL